MAGLIRDWNKSLPPTGNFTLNRGCPQAFGLVAWYPWGGNYMSVAQDLGGVRHVHPVGVNSPTLPRQGKYGERVASLLQAKAQYFTIPSSPVAFAALSLYGWGKPIDASTQTVIYVGTGSGGNNDFFRIVLVSGVVWANSGLAPTTQANAATTATFAVGEWNLFGATFASNSSRRALLNGGNGVTETTTINTGTIGNTRIGGLMTALGAADQYFNGQLGELGVYNRAIPDEIHARLYSPSTRYELWYPLRSPKWISLPQEAAVGAMLYHPGMEGQMSKRMDGGLNA